MPFDCCNFRVVLCSFTIRLAEKVMCSVILITLRKFWFQNFPTSANLYRREGCDSFKRRKIPWIFYRLKWPANILLLLTVLTSPVLLSTAIRWSDAMLLARNCWLLSFSIRRTKNSRITVSCFKTYCQNNRNKSISVKFLSRKWKTCCLGQYWWRSGSSKLLPWNKWIILTS